ncbi:MdtA/MuxA family multidrug efflux RND transporter periplasmic adaptor subunit [Azomonas macrocytogenes]|uniref:Multidrug efflux system membrane fusion protein n=1 Tax=Azomonas macrocytogenes TaxID=69962 RepID=A0A839SZV5_AZOMA|nr:MdtA/MuxA family multidrug efflux RND transporter periplasmic adaptor subunit [Azomonas macrocytogenes]MBB3101786.1 multidrug efflux system membrane fusion protein [Azomonas macrocytogenes]
MSELKVSSTRSGRRWILVGLVVAGLVVLLWWFWPTIISKLQGGGASAGASSDSLNAPPGRPRFGGAGESTPVRVATVQRGRFDVFNKALGTVTPLKTVNVRSRVAGEIVELRFQEGQKVNAGDLLAVVDPRSYKIALNQARGTLMQNRALLKNSELDLQRYQTLYDEDSVARQILDTQRADVNQYKGLIATNEAAVEDAQLNLEYTQIKAPIDGRLGLRQLDLGNIVTANDTTTIVVITQTQPITIAFTLPEADLVPVLTRFRKGEKLLVQAWDRSDRQQLAEGVLQSLDNQIDLTTGTLKLKAQFDNQDELLLPNQFVNVRLRVETMADALLVPSAAVQYGTRGTFVYVVNDRNTAELRVLELGPTNGVQTVVKNGLVQGEKVVLEGTDRLRDGAKVEVVGADGEVLNVPVKENAPAAGAEGRSAGERPAGNRAQHPARERPAQ